VDEIITRFLEAEEQNFSLFNYVNDINSEIERLEHATAEMRNKIEKYRGQGMSSDSQRRRALRDLEDKLSRVQQKIEEHEQRHQKAVRVISQLKNGIHSIFTRIGAGSSSVEELLGNQGVTESNMLQYLGIIEQRTSELLQMYTASQMGQTVFESSLQLPVPVPSEATPKLHVVPPSYEEVSSGDEHDDEVRKSFPLSRL
jgi:chromosome segregation ATPase